MPSMGSDMAYVEEKDAWSKTQLGVSKGGRCHLSPSITTSRCDSPTR
jgi:hypothetical protein